jgi:hypothetical protein
MKIIILIQGCSWRLPVAAAHVDQRGHGCQEFCKKATLDGVGLSAADAYLLHLDIHSVGDGSNAAH